ncbi:MAG: transporter, partial [Bacteroidales bacterium]
MEGCRNPQRQQAEAEGNTSERNVEVEIYAVNERVNQIFFGILMLKAQQEQNVILQELLQSNCDRIDGMVKNGAAIGSDLDAVRAELLTAVQAGVQLKATCDAYCRMMSLLTGKIISSDDGFIKPQAVVVQPLTIKRPELRLIDAQMSEINAAKSVLLSASNPKIGAFAQGFYGNPGLDMFKNMIENKWTLNYVVGIKLQ